MGEQKGQRSKESRPKEQPRSKSQTDLACTQVRYGEKDSVRATPVRAKKRNPKQDRPVGWWPEQKNNHPLMPPDSARTVSTRCSSAPSLAAAGLSSSFKPPARGMRHADAEMTASGCNIRLHSKNSTLTASKRASSNSRGGVFNEAAGRGTFEIVSARGRRMVDGVTSMMPSAMATAQSPGAAGRSTLCVREHDAKQSIKVKEERQPRDLRRGVSSHETNKANGVYDFYPSGQGRVARSAPRRKSQMNGLLKGHEAEATKEIGGREESRSQSFKGDHDTFTGAAGVSAGNWADARYMGPGVSVGGWN